MVENGQIRGDTDDNPPPGKKISGTVGKYYGDQFVVDSEHERIVTALLPSVKVKSRDDRLGLTLVGIPAGFDVTAAISALRAERPQHGGAEGAAVTAGRADRPAGDTTSDLDRLLDELRGCCKARFGGWAPALGKKRVVHRMHFLPYPDAAGGPPPGRPQVRGSGPPERFFNSRKRADGAQVRVGVLDTKLFPQQSDLRGRYFAQRDSLIETSEPWPWWAGHATFVAGLIACEAPAAELHVRSVLSSPSGEASLWDAVRRLVRFAGTVDVLNLSFGCYTHDGEPPLALPPALSLLTPTVVLVAAAGNYGDASAPVRQDRKPPPPDTPVWPAAFPDVLAVGAMDKDDKPARFNPRLTAGVPGQPDDGDFRGLAPWI